MGKANANIQDETRELRQSILESDDLQEELVHMPEWGRTILIRAMTGEERADILQACIKKDGTTDMRKVYALTFIMSVRHPETKERVFELTDQGVLMKKSGKAIERVGLIAMRLSGMREEDLNAAKNDFGTVVESDGPTSSLQRA